MYLFNDENRETKVFVEKEKKHNNKHSISNVSTLSGQWLKFGGRAFSEWFVPPSMRKTSHSVGNSNENQKKSEAI
jgi:hypothetical protein